MTQPLLPQRGEDIEVCRRAVHLEEGVEHAGSVVLDFAQPGHGGAGGEEFAFCVDLCLRQW